MFGYDGKAGGFARNTKDEIIAYNSRQILESLRIFVLTFLEMRIVRKYIFLCSFL